MSVTVTTDDIDIVVVGIRPKYGSYYEGYFVHRGELSGRIWFQFDALSATGNAAPFGKNIHYFVHGAKEDYWRRLLEEQENRKLIKESKKRKKSEQEEKKQSRQEEKKQSSGGLTLNKIVWGCVIIFALYAFREDIYENREEIIKFILSIISLFIDIVVAVLELIMDALQSENESTG